jgi:hypothetical protein
MIQDPPNDIGATGAETDDAIRRIYGPNAVISRVEKFTLVHLDSPSPETVAKREAEFDPGEFFFDDCPICQMAKQEGGHIVYDAEAEDESSEGWDEEEEPTESQPSSPYRLMQTTEVEVSPTASFNLALANLFAAAEKFGLAFESRASGALEERYREDVWELHDQLVEVLWAEESARRVVGFEGLIARARATVAEVCRLAPDLATDSQSLVDALDNVAAAWRNL